MLGFPLLPNHHALAVLLMTALALFLFTRERLPLETSSLLVLMALVVGFELFPFRTETAHIDPVALLPGFGHEALVAVCALIITRCLSWRDATQALSVQVFLFSTRGLSPSLVLALLMLMMAVMTNIVSNNAAAVVGTPIAISVAMELGLPLEPFVLAVLFGANLSFVTPMAYKTNLLVMNAGGYQFSDFVRVGTPLAVIMWLVLSVVLSFAYQL